jgi:hypothetical protein
MAIEEIARVCEIAESTVGRIRRRSKGAGIFNTKHVGGKFARNRKSE